MRLADPICVVHAGGIPGPSADSRPPPPRPMRRPQPDNVSRSQAFGIPGAAFFAPRHSPKGDPRSLHRGAPASNGPGLVTGKPPFGHSVAHPARVSILSTRHGVPRILEDSSSTSSHPPGASFTQSSMIIIECFLIIETRTFLRPPLPHQVIQHPVSTPPFRAPVSRDPHCSLIYRPYMCAAGVPC